MATHESDWQPGAPYRVIVISGFVLQGAIFAVTAIAQPAPAGADAAVQLRDDQSPIKRSYRAQENETKA